MPELPEVETVRRGLNRLIVGKKIISCTSDNPKSFPNAAVEVDAFLINSTVTKILRRAKVLRIDLDAGYSLLAHLKMTGQLVYVPRVESNEDRFGAGHPSDSLINELPDKSTRVIIDFNDGSKLFFNDQRKFGWMRLVPTEMINEIDFIKKLGPEPLEQDFKVADFIDRFKRRPNTSIKAALLDQTVIAGVGNIYADESLWASMVHPKTLVKDVPIKSLKLLYKELRSVMNLSIEKGGSSNQTYVNAEGKKGSYMDFARVFRRDGQVCFKCDAVILKIRVAGRGTHYCPNCQV